MAVRMTYLLEKQRDELLAALSAMTQTFIDGSHYETMNPYCRPVVKDALKTIAKIKGKSDWMDALKD